MGCRFCYDSFGAAFSNHLTCLRCFLRDKPDRTSEICLAAASEGHLDCLICAHEAGCQWNWEICSAAAENGHLNCLKYAHEHGCAWDSETCRCAARNGHLECLQYAHYNGCAWDEETCRCSAEPDFLRSLFNDNPAFLLSREECFRFASSHGCPVTGPAATDLFVRQMMKDMFLGIQRRYAAMIIQTWFRKHVSYNPHHEFGRQYLLSGFIKACSEEMS